MRCICAYVLRRFEFRDPSVLNKPVCVLQEANRKANAFFDGVLPPFSNVGNTGRGDILDAPTLRGIGKSWQTHHVLSSTLRACSPLYTINPDSFR